MALYADTTAVRKLVCDGTVLHSLRVDGTEVFNDTIDETLKLSLIRVMREDSSGWGTTYRFRWYPRISATRTRRDGLSAHGNPYVRVRTFPWSNHSESNILYDNTFYDLTNLSLPNIILETNNEPDYTIGGARFDFSSGVTVHFKYYDKLFSFNGEYYTAGTYYFLGDNKTPNSIPYNGDVTDIINENSSFYEN